MTLLKNTNFLLLLVIGSFTLTPFIRKKAGKDFSSNEFYLLNNIVTFSILVFYFMYLFKTSKCDASLFSKITNTNLSYCVMGAVTGIIGSLAFVALTKQSDVSFFIPQIQPVVILLNIFIAYFLFEEQVDKYKVLGVMCIVTGLFIINYGKLLTNKEK